ncbi:MAG: SGNH/GDSL hydrolase family protein [Gammaproteobacteria bacterium]
MTEPVRRSTGRKCVYWGILILLLVLFIEAASLGALLIMRTRVPWLVYSPTWRFDEDVFNEYRRIRDPVLGWPSRESFGSGVYDLSGARPNPSFPNPGGECVSIYGDSFAYGADVGHEHAWSHVLSRSLGCRVANFGVGGYGTDQAFLRFRDNRADQAPVTILGYFVNDISRNVNQFRQLITGRARHFRKGPGLKPRFVLQDGNLEFSALPDMSFADYTRLVDDPGAYLKHEFYLPGSRYGAVYMKAPFARAVGSLLINKSLWARLGQGGRYSDFFEPNHDSNALEVTVEIIDVFMQQCRVRTKQCFVVIIPSKATFEQFGKTRTLANQPLLSHLDERGIGYLHLAPGLSNLLDKREFASIESAGGGHFNTEGYGMMASLIYEYIQSRSLIQQ